MKPFPPSLWAVALAVVVHGHTHADEPPPDTFRLAVDLAEGSRIIGRLERQALSIRTSYALLRLPLPKIRAIEFDAATGKASVILQNNDRLTGAIPLSALHLAASFGRVDIPLRHIKRLQVLPGTGAVPAGLTLWNSLGSEAEVLSSLVGPPGTFKGGSFTEGRFGGAFLARHDQNMMITFPRKVVSPGAGCIEIWARFSGFPGGLAWGQNPSLFWLNDPGRHFFAIHLNGNDGGGLGGVCGTAGHCGRAATGGFGKWTYARALNDTDVAAWHHYALVWDKDGIEGVSDGKKTCAVFVDGQLNSTRWHPKSKGDPPPILAGGLGLMYNQHLRQGSAAFDSLKVWNYAKTDFSDRDQWEE